MVEDNEFEFTDTLIGPLALKVVLSSLIKTHDVFFEFSPNVKFGVFFAKRNCKG